MRLAWTHFTTWLSTHLSPYWSPSGLVSMTPPDQWRFMWGYVALLVICFLGGLASPFLPLKQTWKQRFLPFFWYNLILGALLFFFRYQRIPLFGMDLWRFLQELEMVIWLGIILYYRQRRYPKELLAEQVVAYRNKYLPKAKS